MADSSKGARAPLRIAVVGLGAIGTKVVEALDRGIEGLTLSAVSAQNPDKHRAWLAGLTSKAAVLPIEALSGAADIVIECAPSIVAVDRCAVCPERKDRGRPQRGCPSR
jgi:aspartate dehydrogenase